VSRTDGRAASRAEDVGVLRARLAAQDGSLSFIAFACMITTFRECLPGLFHRATSSGLIVVAAMAASIRVSGAGEQSTHQDAQDEGNQGNDHHGLRVNVKHVATP
jgi:hypothetical protein